MTRRAPVGTITIVEDHPSAPYEIRVDDQYPFEGRSLAARAASLAAAAELLAGAVEFEMSRQRVLGLAITKAAAAGAWRKLAARYRAELLAAAGDRDECRIEIDGLILDPDGGWSAGRPDFLPLVTIDRQAA